ncbi:MAG: ATP-binding cassette domain-containing protein [Desulfobacterales bacterium]
MAVVGPSGSGKTTLMNLLGCLDRPSEGRVVVNGREIQDENESGLTGCARHPSDSCSAVFLIPTLNVIENVTLPALFAGQKPEWPGNKLLEKVGLKNRLHHLPGQLSVAKCSGWPLPEAWSTLRLFFWRMNPRATWTRKRRHDHGPFRTAECRRSDGGNGHA